MTCAETLKTEEKKTMIANSTAGRYRSETEVVTSIIIDVEQSMFINNGSIGSFVAHNLIVNNCQQKSRNNNIHRPHERVLSQHKKAPLCSVLSISRTA